MYLLVSSIMQKTVKAIVMALSEYTGNDYWLISLNAETKSRLLR